MSDSPEKSDTPESPLPIKMLHDRVMVATDGREGERRSLSGIVIPATASVGKRLAWAVVVATGPNVRSLEVGDRVLYDPEDPNGQGEVEVRGQSYFLLRERDIHAMASPRLSDSAGTGLYL
ncbi:MAG: co-chaperone GroES [Actinobacteria bacterium]|nr:co-chaperone GroES [Actinomycetota bacterium]NBP91414.1 co-chaperone GroES [Actinomycetota bacterium]